MENIASEQDENPLKLSQNQMEIPLPITQQVNLKGGENPMQPSPHVVIKESNQISEPTSRKSTISLNSSGQGSVLDLMLFHQSPDCLTETPNSHLKRGRSPSSFTWQRLDPSKRLRGIKEKDQRTNESLMSMHAIPPLIVLENEVSKGVNLEGKNHHHRLIQREKNQERGESSDNQTCHGAREVEETSLKTPAVSKHPTSSGNLTATLNLPNCTSNLHLVH